MRSNGKPELLPDAHAINNSLNNLFGCPVGSRGKIFEPTYGTYLYDLLHEPLDDRSAFKIRASLIQSIEKWEPRIRIVHSGTYVQPSYSLTGYQIRVQYLYLVSSNVHATSFFVSKV
jgi:phage baseplate assembly protein W